jgi:hypothetical protein
MITRRTTHRRSAELRPGVLAFLERGDLAEAQRENPWLRFTLTFPAAKQARECWQAGDRLGALALLSKLPGSLFIERQG